MLPLALAAALFAGDDTVQLKLVSDGAMSKIGYYVPQKLTLSTERPASIKKAPEGLAAPMYGALPLAAEGSKVFHVILDEPEGKPAVIYIDSNGDGDLTNDGTAEWKAQERGEGEAKKISMWSGGAMLDLGGKEKYDAHISIYRFNPAEPGRAPMKNVILYYRDYALDGEATLGGKKYHVMLSDEMATGDFRGKGGAGEAGSGVKLLIDVNNNGKYESRGEAYDIREPFNIGGTTYEIKDMSRDGLSFKIVKSDKTVAEIPPPPDHSVGKKVTAFDAKDTEGKAVSFPKDFKGKVVMLDFWATWCGPCMGEVPGLVEVYKARHADGFEILGISLDNEKTMDKIKPVTEEKGMTWRQVADGKYWKAEIAQMYVINSIPAAFLVDGDTGEILAAGQSLRGKALEGTIAKALEKKAKK